MARSVTRPTSRRSRKGKAMLSTAPGSRTVSMDPDAPKPTSDSYSPRLDVPWNIIAIDFGTETYSASHYSLVPGNAFEQSSITRIVMAADRLHDAVGPTMAAWHENSWIVGKELQERWQEVPPNKVIRHFKIALYDPHKESPQVRRVQEQLLEVGHILGQTLDQTLDQLLAEFFAYVWNDVWRYINKGLLRNSRKPGLSETLVYLTVPMLVTPDTIERLKVAAVKAGMPNVLFLHEPLCAGATVVEEVMRRNRKGNFDIPNNCTGLVLDCGGGTTDAVLVKLATSRGCALHQMLQVVGQPEGILRGSSSIDASFREWMLGNWPSKGGFAKAATKLRLTQEYILQRATTLFQDHKEEFPHPAGEGHKDIYIKPKNGKGIEVPHDYELLESFFEPHVRAIIGLVRKLIRDDTKFIFLSGGLSANAYFYQRMKDEFQDLDVEHPMQDWRQCPVARGAQLMEHTLDLTHIPSLYALGIVFDNEPFDKELHKDALDDRGKPMDEVVFKDHWWSESAKRAQYVVQDRIMWLLKQRETTANHMGVYESEKLTQQFTIEKDKPTFSVTIVFTRKTDLHDHEPLCIRGGDVKPEFERETRYFELPSKLVRDICNNGHSHWLSPGKDRQNRPLPKTLHLEFFARVSLRHDNKSIEVKAEVLDPKKVKYDRSNKSPMGPTLETEWVQVWNADTHVLKSSLPAPTAELNQGQRSTHELSGPSNPQSARATGYEADDEATRVYVSRLLQDELQESIEGRDSARRLAMANAAQQALAVGHNMNAAGKKRSSNETYPSSSKRANLGPRQMTATDVNSRASLSPSVVYDRPLWSHS